MSSRIRASIVPDKYLAQVDCSYQGVAISPANGGSVLQPVTVYNGVTLLAWPFRFAGIGTNISAAVLTLTVPLLANYPDQDAGFMIHPGTVGPFLVPVTLSAGVLSCSTVLSAGDRTTLQAMLTGISV